MLIQDIAYLKAKLVIIYFFKLVKESIWNRSHPVTVASVQCHWAEGDWTMQQQEKKKKKCGSKLWWSPVISKQFLWHHSCTIYLPNMEELAMSEWVREWVSEWVSIFFLFFYGEWRGGFMSYQSASIFSAGGIMVRYLLILWKENCGGRYVCDEFPEPWASAVIQDSPLPSPRLRTPQFLLGFHNERWTRHKHMQCNCCVHKNAHVLL